MPLNTNVSLKNLESMRSLVGKGLMWVRLTKNDLISEKMATLFTAKGT